MTNSESTRKSAADKIILSTIGWSDVHTDAFKRINTAIANSVTLAYPSGKLSLCVFTDASDLHWGGVITQCEPAELDLPVTDQQHQPLAFISGSFHGAQLNWPTVE